MGIHSFFWGGEGRGENHEWSGRRSKASGDGEEAREEAPERRDDERR